MVSFIQPERIFEGVTAIDPQADIVAGGYRCVFLDIDNTIRSRETGKVPLDVLVWMRDVLDAGVMLCLLSNNWHDNVFALADELGLPVVAKAMKPLPFGYKAALKQMRISAGQALAIGDQLSTDIWGAHGAGIAAYLVEPLSQTDLKHTVLVRKIERALLK